MGVRRQLAGRWSLACFLLAVADRHALCANTCTTEGTLEWHEFSLLIDGKPFEVMFRGSAKIRVRFSARATPWIEAASSEVTVEAPGKVAHYLRGGGSYEHGILFISPTVSLTDLRYTNGVIRASIPLQEGLVARRVVVPCQDLRAGGPEGPYPPHDRAAVIGDLMARARGPTLVLHEVPSKATGHLHLDPATVTFFVIGRQRGWVKLVWDGAAGDLQGWTPASAVRMVETFSGTVSSSIACCGEHSLARGATRRIRSLRVGASIHASAGGTRWGVVKTRVDGIEIEDVPGEKWLRILRNPAIAEISCDPSRSWVLRSDVEQLEPAHGSTGEDASPKHRDAADPAALGL
jgi:hypothetical protein